MFVVTVEFRIREGREAAFLPLILENAATSLSEEPGCRQFDVCGPPEEPSRIFLYEVYDDAAAFEAHKQAPHFKAFDSASAPMVADKQVRILHRLS